MGSKMFWEGAEPIWCLLKMRVALELLPSVKSSELIAVG